MPNDPSGLDWAGQIEQKLQHFRQDADLQRLLKNTRPTKRWQDAVAYGLILFAQRLSPKASAALCHELAKES